MSSDADQARRQQNVDEVLASTTEPQRQRHDDAVDVDPCGHESLRQRTHNVAEKTRDKTHEVAEKTRETTHEAASSTRHFTHRQLRKTRAFGPARTQKYRAKNGHEPITPAASPEV